MTGRDILRVSLDVNVWVAYFDSLRNARSGTAVGEIVHMVRDMRAGELDLQLRMSTEMTGTLEEVLARNGHAPERIAAFTRSLEDLMRTGPEGVEADFLSAGRDQLAMRDREDAGVLAAAVLARTDLLITDILKDFASKDTTSFDTREVVYPNGTKRRLQAIIYERADGVSLVVGHPFDALDWLKTGSRPTPAFIRARYGTPLDKAP